jgi:hypothetical protein
MKERKMYNWHETEEKNNRKKVRTSNYELKELTQRKT